MLLNCHTYYSFGYGTLSIRELMEETQVRGYERFVLSDINNTSAVLETMRRAGKSGQTVIPGTDFRNNIAQQYVGIARNNEGFRELNEHLSLHLHQDLPFEPIAPAFTNAFVIYPVKAWKGQTLRDHEYIGISARDLPHLPFHPAFKLRHKLVVLQSFSFLHKQHFNAHRLLRAIHENTLLSKLPLTQQAADGGGRLMTMPELLRAFEAFPYVIENTERLLNECSVGFEFGKLANKNLRFYTSSHAEDMELLRRECMAGLHYRYPQPSREVHERIEKELEVISKMNFASYFLVNWDIVRYARHKGYYYVGRGSGANSIVAHLLRITDVDPIDLDLYFERFINLYRSNAPDFDIDFSWTDRDDMTRYIFDRFGRERTALLGSYNTFQHDAVIRELGKVFGLPASEIDKLQSPGGHAQADDLGKLVLRYAALLRGFPSHLSIHSSGILISEKPITEYSATFLPPKGYPTTQFSMLEAEDLGLFKFDILSQRGLGKIKDCLEIIKKQRGIEIDVHNIEPFKKDEKVKALLREGKAIGCFYVESPAMRMLLTKLGADDYLRLVAASSIIRPGVSKSGMMREYIVRFREKRLREKARAELPELYDLLEETYGVMVYQEDVIKVAHLFAGLTLAEADHLRRGMSWKFRERDEFFKVEQRFFENCAARGHSLTLVKRIWEQIESFANFAFSKGHSASYAVESFQALYLKAHYPLEYLVATLNNGGGFYRKELYVHEARMHGAKVEAPCVNEGTDTCTIRGNIIFLGLELIAGLEKDTLHAILLARAQGFFKGMEDFVKRVGPSLEQMRLLVRAGALRFTGKDKKQLLWDIHNYITSGKKVEPGEELFESEYKHWHMPPLSGFRHEDAYDAMELLGFPLCSPFELLRDPPGEEISAAELKKQVGRRVSITGYLITIKYTGTSGGARMYFGTFLDRKGEWIDTVHFPPSAGAYPFSGPGCYRLQGRVVEEYGFYCLEVDAMERLAITDRASAEVISQTVS
ncbi:MAG: DNA polymerase III subunit alpha [Bacteroidia bacterium]|nr:DNA polymerase III subunit alpha [Bacteroidia bacterium]